MLSCTGSIVWVPGKGGDSRRRIDEREYKTAVRLECQRGHLEGSTTEFNGLGTLACLELSPLGKCWLGHF